MRCQRPWCGSWVLGLALFGASCDKKAPPPAPSADSAVPASSFKPAAPVASGLPAPVEEVSRTVNPQNLPPYAGPTGNVAGVVTATGDAAPATPEHLLGLLQRGDGDAVRGWLVGRYLAGASIAELADGPIRVAMHALGELWRHEERGIFVEHRATEICLQALGVLRATLPPPTSQVLALGCAPEDDPYRLPTLLAGMVATEAGLRAIDLGPDTPLGALRHAVAEHRPRLVWISATAKPQPARARALAAWLEALPRGTSALIGGRHGEAITTGRGLHYVDTMSELAMIARGLVTRDQ